MDLNNSFEVAADRATAWRVLNDVERIAPCLPGAQLEEIDGDEYKGNVKVKVGPVTAQYKGKATFVEQNEAEGKVIIKGAGRDSRGAGNANALITATLHEIDANNTRVDVHTDLSITGKAAQFGRGVMAEVSAKLMGKFAENLQELLAEEQAGDNAAQADTEDDAAATEPVDADEGPRKIDMPEAEAVDLLDAAGASVFKRVLPIAGVAALLLILRRLFRKG
ncbi:MAG: carbon monoxide dehydrogenase subunit G [Paracrocinitomix sp.]|jgi:carbon monoxide dehydrogenase subunit G